MSPSGGSHARRGALFSRKGRFREMARGAAKPHSLLLGEVVWHTRQELELWMAKFRYPGSSVFHQKPQLVISKSNGAAVRSCQRCRQDCSVMHASCWHTFLEAQHSVMVPVEDPYPQRATWPRWNVKCAGGTRRLFPKKQLGRHPAITDPHLLLPDGVAAVPLAGNWTM